MNPDNATPPSEPESARPPTAVPEDRLTKIADLLGGCPPPDMAGGYDQCAHGTWPCVITQAAWLAQGRDRDQEIRAACQAAAHQAETEDASWEAYQEQLTADQEGRLPWWDADAEPEAGSAVDTSTGHPSVATFAGALARKLSDRTHSAADDRARALGWAVTETRGWLGLGGRSYRDPRFAARPQAHQTAQATSSARHG